VCPRISEKTLEDDAAPQLNDLMEPQSSTAATQPKPPSMTVEKMMELFSALSEFSRIKIAELHGRMPSEEKAATMAEFDSGKISILVSTTVIEVGVDVHNATLMVIIDAENFGISQLHQLRGRIGRGGLPGTCLLTTWLDADHPSVNRLRTVVGSIDGFELAEADLAERKEGNILGVQQSGSRSSLKVLSVMKDRNIIERARDDVALLTRSG